MGDDSRPSLQCLEAINYSSVQVRAANSVVGHTAAEELNEPNALGWHGDRAALYTVAVALHTTGVDFDGG